MKKSIILLLGLVLVLTCFNTAWAADAGMVISPQEIDIGLNFKGADLNVSGTAPEDSDVFIKVASPNDSVLELNKKGKVGLFWMNVEKTNVTSIPKLYQVMSSQPLNRVPSALGDQLGIDQNFSYVYSNAKVIKHTESGSEQLDQKDSARYINALINIYKQSGLYTVKENGVKVEGDKFQADIILPPNIPQEECNITVYAIKDGKLVSTYSAPFKVNGVGLVKWLNREAIYDGPTFGFLAVMIALAFGVGIALLFSYFENVLSGGKKTGFNPGASH